MVTSQLSNVTETSMRKPFLNQLLLPMGPPDVLASDYLDFDFSDVFGPAPDQALIEPSYENSRNMVAALEVNEFVYDDPTIISRHSYSLVGSTTLVSRSLKLSKLTLHDSEDSLELVEGASVEKLEEFQKPSIDDSAFEEPSGHFDNYFLKTKGVGTEDFEVLKVVGQGAFGKVFQVRKSGTSEIYAMKVMRKDKIMEKNHIEYMKAERDILTKVDHSFIVRLRYSFQVMTYPITDKCLFVPFFPPPQFSGLVHSFTILHVSVVSLQKSGIP